jgi:hypothetical protein
VDHRLPGWLRRELKKSVKPAVTEVKRDIRNLPVRGHGHTGLRRKIARGIQVRASVGRGGLRGASLRIVTTMPQPNEAIIPRGFTRHEGFRHPVFGTDHWVHQPPLVEWHFKEDIASHRDDIARNMLNVLSDAAQRIADAGHV